VSATLGQNVSAGQVIARLENSSQSAAVVQAQGAYAGAQAALEKASGTTAQNSATNSGQANQSAQNVGISALATLTSTYASLDDAVHTKTDTLFSNPRGTNQTLVQMTVPDSQLVLTIQNQRAGLEAVLNDAKNIANDTDPNHIDINIISMRADAQTISTFLNNMVAMVNQAVPGQNVGATAIAGYQTSVGLARSEVVASISALTAAKNAYDAAASGATTAANSASTGTQSDIAAAQANVQQALGALDAAQANFEKTIIRSPLSGTIVSLPIKRGDYVTAFSPAAIVSNASALEIVTHVTSDDAKTLVVGSSVAIMDSVSGVITSIAPAIDPTTKEIEVHIGVTTGASTLTDGESINLTLTRTNTSSNKPGTTAAPATLSIPIVTLKITPEGPVVFTVSTSSTLIAHPVTLGSILGDRVIILSGITPDEVIVSDARGLTVGQSVDVTVASGSATK
jgi:RND family efflux transporter MFP subunit